MNDLMMASEPNWARLSEAWERSGQSQKAFCKKRGVPYPTFCYRRAELKKRERQAAQLQCAPTREVAQFLPVSVENDELTGRGGSTFACEPKHTVDEPIPEIEVELPFGVLLRFRGMVKQ